MLCKPNDFGEPIPQNDHNFGFFFDRQLQKRWIHQSFLDNHGHLSFFLISFWFLGLKDFV